MQTSKQFLIEQFVKQNQKSLNKIIENEIWYVSNFLSNESDSGEFYEDDDLTCNELSKCVIKEGVKELTSVNGIYVGVKISHLKDIDVKMTLFNLKKIKSQRLEKGFTLSFYNKINEQKTAGMLYTNYYADESDNYFLLAP